MPRIHTIPDDFHPWAPSFADYMWFTRWDLLRVGSGCRQLVEGRLKPVAGDAREVRRGFLDTFEKIMETFAALGAEHVVHPVIRIGAYSTRRLSGSDDFAAVYCEVTFEIYIG
jgi:hypothetical protein